MTLLPVNEPRALPASISLGPLPIGRAMETVDQQVVRAPLDRIFGLARDVEHWPALLAHYRFVRFRERDAANGGVVEMAANRPFGLIDWPTWWLSEMEVRTPADAAPVIRFRHIGGITKGMDVAWTFETLGQATLVKIIHVWDGPSWPMIGVEAARMVIGPIFVHGIASRTLSGLAQVAEKGR